MGFTTKNMHKKPQKLSKTPEQSGNSSLIVQSNKLINGRYDMTLLEKRIFLKMVSMINPGDTEFKPLLIDARELIHDLDLKGESLYSEFKKATKKLMQHVCEIKEPDGLLQISLASSVKYYEGQGFVEISFDQKLKPYLLELQNNFTVFGLGEALSLKSLYSLRMYELLKQFIYTGIKIATIEDLKRCLNIVNQYNNYADFKRYVIISAQKELKDTDMAFEFTEIKIGKKVDRLQFIFQKAERTVIQLPKSTIIEEQTIQKSQPIIINNTKKETVSEDKIKVYESLINLKMSDYQAKAIMQKATDKEIYQVHYQVTVALLDPKIKNKPAYAYSVFKKKFNLD